MFYQYVSEQWGAVVLVGSGFDGQRGEGTVCVAGCRASVSVFIKPADGFLLPEIMKWIKQTCV
jgi:hypothetical protein